METNARSRSRLRSAPPAELEAHLGYWLQLVANHVSRRLSARMKKFGTSEAEWMVLRELYRPNPPAAIQLASALGMTRSALSKLLVRLSQKQLIETWPAESDRRTIRIELTSTGRVITECSAHWLPPWSSNVSGICIPLPASRRSQCCERSPGVIT